MIRLSKHQVRGIWIIHLWVILLPLSLVFLFAVYLLVFLWTHCRTTHEANTHMSGPRSIIHLWPQLAASSRANMNPSGRGGWTVGGAHQNPTYPGLQKSRISTLVLPLSFNSHAAYISVIIYAMGEFQWLIPTKSGFHNKDISDQIWPCSKVGGSMVGAATQQCHKDPWLFHLSTLTSSTYWLF